MEVWPQGTSLPPTTRPSFPVVTGSLFEPTCTGDRSGAEGRLPASLQDVKKKRGKEGCAPLGQPGAGSN